MTKKDKMALLTEWAFEGLAAFMDDIQDSYKNGELNADQIVGKCKENAKDICEQLIDQIYKYV